MKFLEGRIPSSETILRWQELIYVCDHLFVSVIVTIALSSFLLRTRMKYVPDFYMPLTLPKHVL